MKTNTARVATPNTSTRANIAAVTVAEESSAPNVNVNADTETVIDAGSSGGNTENVDATKPTEKTEREKLDEMTAAAEKAQMEKFAERERQIAEEKEKQRLAEIEAEQKREQKWKDDEQAEFENRKVQLDALLGGLNEEQVAQLRSKVADEFVQKRADADAAEKELIAKQEAARRQRIENQVAALNAKIAALEKEKETGVIVKPLSGAPTSVKVGPTRVSQDGAVASSNHGSRMQIMGHSLCSVLRQLGHAGVTTAQAKEICARNGQDPSPTTISIQIGNGRRGNGNGPLSAEQIQQLIAG